MISLVDLLEESSRHLRRIHYTLVISCAAVLLAVTATPDRSIQRAIDQLQLIMQAVDSWDERWLSDYADEITLQEKARFSETHIGLPDELNITLNKNVRGLLSQGFQFSSYRLQGELSRDWTILDPEAVVLPQHKKGEGRPPVSAYGIQISLINPPVNLQEFSDLWNILSNEEQNIVSFGIPPNPVPALFLYGSFPQQVEGVIDITLNSRAVPQSKADEINHKVTRGELMGYNISDCTPYFQRLEDKVTFPIPPRGAKSSTFEQQNSLRHCMSFVIDSETGHQIPAMNFVSGKETVVRFIVPVLWYQTTFKPIEKLRSLVSSEIVIEDFDTSFFELQQHAKIVADLPFSRIREFLDTVELAARSEIQLVGLKFPASAIGVWGTALILIIQLYFYVSLGFFLREAGNETWKFPWIGFYGDPTPRICFLVSVCVLPVVVIVLILIFNFRLDVSVFFSSLNAAITVCASVVALNTALVHRKLIVSIQAPKE